MCVTRTTGCRYLDALEYVLLEDAISASISVWRAICNITKGGVAGSGRWEVGPKNCWEVGGGRLTPHGTSKRKMGD